MFFVLGEAGGEAGDLAGVFCASEVSLFTVSGRATGKGSGNGDMDIAETLAE